MLTWLRVSMSTPTGPPPESAIRANLPECDKLKPNVLPTSRGLPAADSAYGLCAACSPSRDARSARNATCVLVHCCALRASKPLALARSSTVRSAKC